MKYYLFSIIIQFIIFVTYFTNIIAIQFLLITLQRFQNAKCFGITH